MDGSNSNGQAPTSGGQNANDAARSRNRRGGSKRPSRFGDSGDQNRQRPRGDRGVMAGFGDGIERAFCAAVVTQPPRAFPVQHRTGVSVVQPVIVARGERSVLFCDCEHAGPHIWPNGEFVE